MDALGRIELEETPDAVVARIVGDVDISNVHAMRRELTRDVPNSALGLVVDLSEVGYLDSSGVFLLFELARALEGRRQRLCVVAPPSLPSARVLQITGLDRLVPMAANVDDAVKRVVEAH